MPLSWGEADCAIVVSVGLVWLEAAVPTTGIWKLLSQREQLGVCTASVTCGQQVSKYYLWDSVSTWTDQKNQLTHLDQVL